METTYYETKYKEQSLVPRRDVSITTRTALAAYLLHMFEGEKKKKSFKH